MNDLAWASGIRRDFAAESEMLLSLLRSKLATQIQSAALDLGDAVVIVRRNGSHDFFKILKLDSELRFDFMSSITAVDWLDGKPERFEVVYHLMSTAYGYRLRVKVPVAEDDAEIASVAGLWNGANFMEREVFDMYGIRFNGHPDLRRILMYDEFKGHPLKKDYPLQAKQPRVPLRYPEVQNTARNMLRPPLVKIGPKKGSHR